MTIVVPPGRPSPPIVVESQVGPDIDVVVDRGPRGAKGDQGDQGDTGPQGPQGETGPQGQAGVGGLADGDYGDMSVYDGGASVIVEGSSNPSFYAGGMIFGPAAQITFPYVHHFQLKCESAGNNYSLSIGSEGSLSGVTKTIAIGGSGLSGSTANISIGSAVSGALGALTINSPTVTFSSSVASISAAYASMAVFALGIGTPASGTHALNIAGQSSSFNHDGAGHTVFLNKSASGDTSSAAFQTAATTRGEIGLIGNNNLVLRTSPDGSAFTTALTAASADGAVTLHKPVLLEGQSSDPGSPANGTLWYDSTRDDLKARVGGITHIISRQSDVPFLVPPSGEYIPTNSGLGGTSAGTLAGAANRVDIYPYVPGADITIDRLLVNCTTAVASSQIKIVIYGSDSNGRPDALLYETAALSTATTGQKFEDISPLSLLKGRTYWFGIRHSSTATLSSWAVAATPDINGGTAISTSARKILRRTLTFATAATDPWGFVSSEISSAAATAIWMRIT